jgi:ribosomal protein S18 acetylase RimI-like enzyme
MHVQVERYRPEWGEAIEELQRRYIAANPKGTKFVPKGFYDHHPDHVVYAVGDNGTLVGYGALDPTPAEPTSSPEIPNTIWIGIRVDPKVGEWEKTQDTIYGAILERALTWHRDWKDRSTRLAISYPESRQEELAYFASKGFAKFEVLCQMGRDLSKPLQAFTLPAGTTATYWTMETAQDKEKYLKVENVMFPDAPRSLDDLEAFIQSWTGGTPIMAFDQEGNIAGSVMAYWYGGELGLTEDVFVVPQWQRLGVARYLITEGMRYLQRNGLKWAGLEVKESNHPAVRLYRSLGYQVGGKHPVSAKEVEGWLRKHGFEILRVSGDRQGNPHTAESGRAIFWARKPG